MEQPLLEWIVGQAGLAGLAAFAIFIVRQTYADALRREQEHSQANREDKAQVITVIRENAKAMTALEAAIQHMCEQQLGKPYERT